MTAELGMDWLAFELVEGVRRGDEPPEDGFTLRGIRERANGPSDVLENTERFPSPVGPATPFLGDDRLEWAVRYVGERPRAALDEMACSLDTLDEIVSGVDARPSVAPIPTTRLILRSDDRVDSVDRAKVEGTRGRLSTLQGALDSWLLNERTNPQQ